MKTIQNLEMKKTDLFDFNHNLKDPLYKIVRDDPSLLRARRCLEQMWSGENGYMTFADRQFKQQLTERFHERSWEMYLGFVLLSNGHKLIQKSAKGPDIKLEFEEYRIWIEAVAPSGGDPEITHPQNLVSYDENEDLDAPFQPVPDETIVLRIIGALKEKHEKLVGKYDKNGKRIPGWIEKGTVDPKDPYIVAINVANIPYASAGNKPSYGVRAVAGLGNEVLDVGYNSDTIRVLGHRIERREHVEKWSEKQNQSIAVSSTIFADFPEISAVLYSGTFPSDFCYSYGSEYRLLRNSKASNPLPTDWNLGVGTVLKI